jgi:hypothetical protein
MAWCSVKAQGQLYLTFSLYTLSEFRFHFAANLILQEHSKQSRDTISCSFFWICLPVVRNTRPFSVNLHVLVFHCLLHHEHVTYHMKCRHFICNFSCNCCLHKENFNDVPAFCFTRFENRFRCKHLTYLFEWPPQVSRRSSEFVPHFCSEPDSWSLAGAGNFSLHHRVQNSSGALPPSYPMGIRSSFPGR